jgi:Tfp pilus assembly protein PilX
MKIIHKNTKTVIKNGFMTVTLLGMLVVFSILMVAILSMINLTSSSASKSLESQKAFNIAEAGVNYYLWHLSHNPTDFKDGGTTPATPDPKLGYGPYTHNYIDDNAKKQGTFTIWVNPQGSGSTIATITSIGNTNSGKTTRTIEAKIGSPSFANYSVVSDTALWFGSTESANGPVHSNQGVRMDGASSTDVSSANTTYNPSVSLGGDGSSHPGVWCSSSIITPVNCNTRPKTDWLYPMPSVDFNKISGDLCTIKKEAFKVDPATSALASQANACTQTPTTRTAAYLPQRSTSGTYSISKGYLIELNNDNTYNLSQVNAETDTNSTYLTALTRVSVASNIAIPTSGIIFAEDNVWVRSNSTFKGRLTIGAGRLATASTTHITIADDIVYSQKNGSDALGLITEGDVVLSPYAPPASGNFNFEVDAAVISQTGSVIYPLYYRSAGSTCTKGWTSANQTFTYYGAVASRQSWTWTWQLGGPCGNAVSYSGHYITGILNNSTQYDYNLQYAPPPFFPITGSYNILAWHEIITSP